MALLLPTGYYYGTRDALHRKCLNSVAAVPPSHSALCIESARLPSCRAQALMGTHCIDMHPSLLIFRAPPFKFAAPNIAPCMLRCHSLIVL